VDKGTEERERERERGKEKGEEGKRLTRKSREEKTECIDDAAATLGRPHVAIPTLIANHFSSRPRRLLPIHFGGGGAPSSDCPAVSSFPSVYIRVSRKIWRQRRLSRGEVGENISLAHLLISAYLYLISTPALCGEGVYKAFRPSREPSFVHRSCATVYNQIDRRSIFPQSRYGWRNANQKA